MSSYSRERLRVCSPPDRRWRLSLQARVGLRWRGTVPAWVDWHWRGKGLDFQDHWHDQRAFLGLLVDVAFQVGADFFFDYAVVCFFFLAGVGQRVFNHASGAFQKT